MRPFFSYYGGKYRLAPRYPEPRFDTIIEPFAGSAGYSVRYPWKKVILYEINPKVFGVWDYLIKASPVDILRLPLVEHVDEANVCQEAKWLIGFWLAKARQEPAKRASSWMVGGTRPNAFWSTAIRQLIANQINRIRHWRIENKCFTETPNMEASWFIDPPYNGTAGRVYPFSDIDYPSLGDWCRSRKGQVIVCEMNGAAWLPFEHFHHSQGTNGPVRTSICHEVIWTND